MSDDAIESIQKLIDARHALLGNAPTGKRGHLGCSQLGHPCDRAIWLGFRWAIANAHSGRVLRIFRRGQNEEATVVADLELAGMYVKHSGKAQLRVEFDSPAGHVAGSVDGVVTGVPCHPPLEEHVLEIKTHNKKSFDALVRAGVKASKVEHYIQMQLYMHGLGLGAALYVAVCKDDDRMHCERVEYDRDIAQRFLDRGARLSAANRMPEASGTSIDSIICKWCDAKSFCWETHCIKSDSVNCRTCAHSTPMPGGEWRCEQHDNDDIPVDAQRGAYECHTLHPDLVPWKQGDAPDEWTAVYLVDNRKVGNGNPAPGVYASTELLANAQWCASGNEYTEQLRTDFDARITG